MSHEAAPRPVVFPMWSPGVRWMLVLIAIGLAIVAARFFYGLTAVTNLDQQFPWGLWIAIDVATGVALAAGGFTSAALVYIFNREHYHAVARPALLTALLGYTFVAIGLSVDLGRPYNIWHPILPGMANPNSVLFEVGICVMIYLTVLVVEFAPIACERLAGLERFPRLTRFANTARRRLEKVMFPFVIAGVVLSCAHQSSLGSLLLIAPSKVHPLWWTPILPLLFLLSAAAVGFPMVIVESLIASRAMKLKPETQLLAALSRYLPAFLGIYLAFKVGDLLIRDAWVALGELNIQSVAWFLEVGIGVVLPLVITLTASGRRSPRALFASSMLVVIGVALNRINVFLVAYQPKSASGIYVPAVTEWIVTAALIAALMLGYRFAVRYLPVISHESEVESEVKHERREIEAA